MSGIDSDDCQTGVLDRMLQAVRLLASSEAGYARDRHAGIVERQDLNRDKFNAYILGVMQTLSVSQGRDGPTLRLLSYLLMLCDKGPGTDTLRAADLALALLDRRDLRRYAELGRRTVLRMFAHKPTEPGAYARLLVADMAASNCS